MHSLYSTYLQISLLYQKQLYLMYVSHPSAKTKETSLWISDCQDLLLKSMQFLCPALTTIYLFSRLHKHIPSVRGIDVLWVYLQLTI